MHRTTGRVLTSRTSNESKAGCSVGIVLAYLVRGAESIPPSRNVSRVRASRVPSRRDDAVIVERGRWCMRVWGGATDGDALSSSNHASSSMGVCEWPKWILCSCVSSSASLPLCVFVWSGSDVYYELKVLLSSPSCAHALLFSLTQSLSLFVSIVSIVSQFSYATCHVRFSGRLYDVDRGL